MPAMVALPDGPSAIPEPPHIRPTARQDRQGVFPVPQAPGAVQGRDRDGAYKTRLYRALGYDTFEECCEVEVEADKRRVNQLIAATEVIEVLGTKVPKIPAREAHARPLTALRPPGPAPGAVAWPL